MSAAPMPTPPEARPCPRCGVRPCRVGQRLCGPCHLAYKRARRGITPPSAGETEETRETLSMNGVAAGAAALPGVLEVTGVVRARHGAPEKGRPAPAPPAPYVPFADAPAPQEPWYTAFLSDLAINGGISLAAAAAGVHRNRVYRRMGADPAFAAEVEAAQGYYRDLLEWESVNLARRKDNPLPYFARLKAELPSRYIDRQAVFLAGSAPLDPAAGQTLLATMLGQLPAPLPTAQTDVQPAEILPVRPNPAG